MHAAALRNRADYKIVACVDPVAERRSEAEQQFGAKTFPSFEEFLKAPADAELVVIATSTDTHSALSLQSLQAGLHVLVEKPMAIDLVEAEQLVAEAARASTLFTVHQSWRCQAEFRQLQSIIRSGILGRVFLVKIIWNKFGRRNDWQTLLRYGGGMLNNTCAHSIDLALQLLGSRVTDVWADLQLVLNPGDAEDHVKLLIRGANDRVIELEASSACIAPQSMYTVMGSLGSAWLDGDEFVLKYLDPGTLKPLHVDASLAAPQRRYGVPDDVLVWNEKRLPRKPEELALSFYSELWQSIRRGRELLVKPAEVYEQIRVIALARQRSRFLC